MDFGLFCICVGIFIGAAWTGYNIGKGDTLTKVKYQVEFIILKIKQVQNTLLYGIKGKSSLSQVQIYLTEINNDLLKLTNISKEKDK